LGTTFKSPQAKFWPQIVVVVVSMGAALMKRDLARAVKVLVDQFGATAHSEAVSRYRDSIRSGQLQRALAWRHIADAIDASGDAATHALH
jgi:hypothetical protein